MEALSNNSRRCFLRTSTILGLGTAFGSKLIGQTLSGSQTITTAKRWIGGNAIRPFHVHVPETELTELRR
jgi:hypothetical protein